MASRPRRQRGEGAVYQRPDGLWTGQLELPPGPDGKRRRRTIYGHSQREVIRKITEEKRRLAERGDLPTSDMTVETWLTYWLTEIAEPRLKPSARRGYRTAVNQHLIPALGRKRLGRLSPADVRAMHRYVMGLPNPRKKGEHLSPTTALNAHRVLSSALKDALREGRIGYNPASLAKAPKKAASRRQGLPAPDALKVLRQASKDDRLGSRWWAGLLLGLRQGEALGLRWDHVDLDDGIIDVSWSLQRVGYRHGCGQPPTCCHRFGAGCPQRALDLPRGIEYVSLTGTYVLLRPKTHGSQRVVPVATPAMLAALRLRAERAAAERPSYTVDHGLVWCRSDGHLIDPREDWQAWRDLLTAAGVDPVTLHEARHTAATLLLEAGVDTKVIMEILGHSSVVTSRGYQHVSMTLARQALAEVARRLELD